MKKSMKVYAGLLCGMLMTAMLIWPSPGSCQDKTLVVGSKEFTEQRVLGQILIALLEKNGFKVEDKTGLGGTVVARQALVSKQIDMYPEYTGTGLLVHLKEKEAITDSQKCYDTVKKLDLERNGLVWMDYMSFNNTYCLLMRKDNAQKLNIKSLSDLSKYIKANPDKIAFGLNAEFYARADGYRPLQEAYDFKFAEDKIVKMDPGLLYKALKDDQIQVAMGFATDGRIKGFDLVVLEDDKHYFPVYNASVVLRKETAEKYKELDPIFKALAGKLDSASITDLNYQVDIEHKAPKDVAAEWLKAQGLI